MLLLHPGHEEHAGALSFSVNEFVVLFMVAVVALILHGGNPGRWRPGAYSSGSPGDGGVPRPERAGLGAQVLAVAVGVAGLALVAPLIGRLIYAATASRDITAIAGFVEVPFIAALVAKVARRRRVAVVGLLALLGYFVAFQLASTMPFVGPAAVLGFAAATMMIVCLPQVPWEAQGIRLVALAACWVGLRVTTARVELDIDSVQLLPAIAAAVTAVLPAAVIAAVERVRAGRRAHPVIHGERASLAGPSVAPGAPAQTGEPASP